MASDAVENLDFFVPVGFDLNQIFRKWAFFIFWAADGRDNPVSLLSSETMVGIRKCDHICLGSRRVLRGKEMKNNINQEK